MEYLPGGDLFSLMIRNNKFSEDVIQFYLAEITLALNALHTLGFVHRDIKPENILLDRLGHLKLADFGSATAIEKDGHITSFTPAGTPDYIGKIYNENDNCRCLKFNIDTNDIRLETHTPDQIQKHYFKLDIDLHHLLYSAPELLQPIHSKRPMRTTYNVSIAQNTIILFYVFYRYLIQIMLSC